MHKKMQNILTINPLHTSNLHDNTHTAITF